MATAARLALSAWRNETCARTIKVVGLDLTDADFELQVRLKPDTPGDALIDLTKQAEDGAEGIYLAGVETVDGAPVSTLTLTIDTATMQGLPYAGEVGDNATLAYAMQIDGQTRLFGDFVVLASAFDSDSAPTDRPSGSATASSAAPWSSATLTVASEDVITVAIDGAEAVGALVAKAEDYATAAAASEAAAAASAAEVPAINAKIDFYDYPTYGQDDVHATGAPSAANIARWFTAPIGETGPLNSIEIGCDNAGTVKVVFEKPNADNAGRWDSAAPSISFTCAAGKNVFDLAAIQAAAGGDVIVTADMCIGLYAAASTFSTTQGAAGSGQGYSGDPSGLTLQPATATTAQPMLKATVKIVTDTPINEHVADLEAAQAAIEVDVTTNTGDIDRSTSLDAPLISSLVTGYVDAGGVSNGAGYWGTDADSWRGGVDIAASGADVSVTDSQIIARVKVPVNLTDADLAKQNATLILRPGNSPNLASKDIQPGDVVIGPIMYDLADLGIDAGSAGYIGIPIPAGFGGAFAKAKRLYWDLQGYAADGTTRKKFRIGHDSGDFSALDQGAWGWFGNGSLSNNVANNARNAATAQIATFDDSGEDAAPMPSRVNCAALRQYRYRRRRLTREVPEAIQNVIGLFGTSWTDGASRWSTGFAVSVIAEQGDAGGGWTGAGFYSPGTTPYVDGGDQPSSIKGNIRPTLYPITYVGDWASGEAGAPSDLFGLAISPDMCCAQSSTADDYLLFKAPAAAAISGVTLYWVNTADGEAEYSWDNASWTSIATQGANIGDAGFAALAGAPSAGPATLYVRVVSGTVKVSGINWKSSAAGAVLHKFAAGGQNINSLATIAVNASWQAAIASFGLNTASVFEGTNDQNVTTAAQFADNYVTVTTALRTAIPAADILIAVEAENQREGNIHPMKEFAAAARQVAADNAYAFYDTQNDFGSADDPDFYGPDGPLPLFDATKFHPEPTTGGQLLETGFLITFNEAP